MSKPTINSDNSNLSNSQVVMTNEQLSMLLTQIKQPGKPKEDKPAKATPADIAKQIMTKYNFISISGDSDRKDMYCYDKKRGVYINRGREFIAEQIVKIDSQASKNKCVEVVHHICIRTIKDRDELNKNEHLLNVTNGMVNLDTKELTEHNPEYCSTKQLNIIYDPDAKCPIINKFFGEIVNSDNVPLLYEFVGYLLVSGYPIHKAFMLVGDGRNGKTTFMRLLKEFIGKGNWSAILLQELSSQDRFSKWSLVNRMVNICDDLPSKSIDSNYTGTFRMITGESPMTAEKKFADKIEFLNECKMIFACNRIPPAHGAEDAYYSRWIIINFPNRFLAGENQDSKLIQKLTMPEELSGLLNVAIESRHKLLANGKFSTDVSDKKTKELYLSLIGGESSVAKFIAALVRHNGSSMIPKRKLYESYLIYCREHGFDMNSEDGFHREFKSIMGDIKEYMPSIGNKRVRAYQGIKIEPFKEFQTMITEEEYNAIDS